MALLLLDTAVKGFVLLTLATCVIACIGHASAATRHYLWAVCLGMVLLIPVFSASLPSARVLPRWSIAHEEAAVGTYPETIPVVRARIPEQPIEQSKPRVRSVPNRQVMIDEDLTPTPSARGPVRVVTPPPPPKVSQRSTQWTLSDVLLSMWATGALLMLIPLTMGAWTGRRLAHSFPALKQGDLFEAVNIVAEELQINPPHLHLGREGAMPMVWGIFRGHLLLPCEATHWGAVQQRAVLLHEMAHLRRRDPFTMVIGQLARAMHWFNPFAWLAVHRLRIEREQACDDFVLCHGMKSSDYASCLLNIASSLRPNHVAEISLAMADASRVERRVRLILDVKQNRSGVSRQLALLTWMPVLLFTVSLSMVKATDERPASQKPNSQAKNVEPVAHVQGEPNAKPTAADVNAAPDAASSESAAPVKKRKSGTSLFSQVSQALGSMFGAAPETPPREYSFKITSSTGKPVVGATVTGTGINRGWIEGVLPIEEAKSDADGNVRVVLTREMDRIVSQSSGSRGLFGGEHSGVSELGLRVDHPDHPVWSNSVEIKGERRIVLADATTITIRARREHQTELATGLYPQVGGDWNEADGVLTLRRVDLSNQNSVRTLRIVQAPETGPLWFSDVVDLKKAAGEPASLTIELDVTLKPGVRVEGRLDDAVPRPIKNGRVMGSASPQPRPERERMPSWSVIAEIAADGTFVLDSFPQGDHLELIALCEGWASRSPTKSESAAYGHEHNLSGLGKMESTACMVLGQLFPLNQPTVQPVIRMEKTGECEVTVVDQDGSPIVGAEVIFQPNYNSHAGSGSWLSDVLRPRWDSSRNARKIVANKRAGITEKAAQPEGNSSGDYVAKTNKDGIAVVSDLPVPADAPDHHRLATLQVVFPGFVSVSNVRSSSRLKFSAGLDLVTKLTSGETAALTVHMTPFGSTAANIELSELDSGDDDEEMSMVPVESGLSDQVIRLLNASNLHDVEANELAGIVVDEWTGKPLAGTSVKLVDCTDNHSTQTDANGLFRLRNIDADTFEGTAVIVSHEGYAKQVFSNPQLGAKGWVILLGNKTWIEGNIADAEGRPVPGATISARCQVDRTNGVMEQFPFQTVTRADGTYQLFVTPNEYEVRVSADGIGVALSSNIKLQHQQVLGLAVLLYKGVRFEANVVDSLTGKPVEGFALFTLDRPQTSGRSNADGKIIFNDLFEERLQFNCGGGEKQVCSVMEQVYYGPGPFGRWWSSDAVEKRERLDVPVDGRLQGNHRSLTFDLKTDMRPVTIVVEQGVTFSGRVTNPQGQPVDGVMVALSNNPEFSSRTNQHGNFSFVAPASHKSQYRLTAHDGDLHDCRTWADSFSSLLQTTPGQKVEDLKLQLNEPATIRGRVTNNGKPVANRRVQALGTGPR